ncbi:hypothetical protein I5U56_02810 [Stenotrophomonas maltophilia]|nr:hypothetical protein [Stenotrophomonas maltophilia]
MSNDKTTLADAQPGGRVRLGDQAERARFEQYRGGDFERDAQGYYTNPSTAQDWAMWQAALTAQPSPGGQDVREQFETWLDTLRLDRSRHGDGYVWNDVELAWRAVEKFAARQPVGEPITVEAVAEIFNDPEYGLSINWLLENGIGELQVGDVLMVADRAITDEDGSGEVYAGPPAQVVDPGKIRQLIGDLRAMDVKESTKNDNAGFVDLRCYWALLGLAGEIERSMADSQAMGYA